MNGEPNDERSAPPAAGPAGPASAGTESRALRSVLGHFATGVALVTALDGGEPVGLTCNSFTSVSLDPPLVLFCPARTSTTWPRIRAAGHFAVNFLGEGAEDLARLFAASGADRFAGVAWRRGPGGAPLLDDALAYLECLIDAEHDGGDHVVVVGRVVGHGQRHDPGGPLVFYRGGYGRWGPNP